ARPAPSGDVARQRRGPPLPPPSPPPHEHSRPRCDARPPRSRLASVALTTLEGIAAHTAVLIRSASGTARHRGPRVQHGWRWLGRCPQPTISGGKVLARRGGPPAPRRPGAPPPSPPPCAPAAPAPRGASPPP